MSNSTTTWTCTLDRRFLTEEGRPSRTWYNGSEAIFTNYRGDWIREGGLAAERYGSAAEAFAGAHSPETLAARRERFTSTVDHLARF